jgi:hypothetical protein
MPKAVAGWTSDVAGRFALAVAALGGGRRAAALSGAASNATVYKACKPGIHPRFMIVAAVAKAAGVSVDWIATGEGRGPDSAEEAPAAEPQFAYPEPCSVFDRMLTQVDDIYGDETPDGAEKMRRAAWMMLKALGDA